MRTKVFLVRFAIILFAAGVEAQPRLSVFAGGRLAVAAENQNSFGSRPGGRSTGLSFGAALERKGGGLSLRGEFDLPTTTTHEDSGSLKSGPVTYIVSQRHWAASALLAHGIKVSESVSLQPAIGAGIVGITPDVYYSYLSSTAAEVRRFAWIGGLGLQVRQSHFLLEAPVVRVRFLTGDLDDVFQRVSPRIWSVGANAGWSF